MTRTTATVLAVLLVAIAGCAGSPAGGPAGDDPADTSTFASTDEPTAAATSASDSPDADGGTVDFYVSDEPNAIGDFAHLNVTITTVGFARDGANGSAGNDSGGWVERPAGNRTVDLTRLVGANASLVGTFDVPAGEYTRVLAYVGAVNATLTNGEHVTVKLPSEKLQLDRPFSVESNSSVQFVFDIAVHEAGKSGKYVLKPVIGESGTDVPIEDVDGETEDENEDGKNDDRGEEERDDERNETDGNEGGKAALNATFVGNVTAGENATLQVTNNGTAVENATVTVNEEVVATTGPDGTVTFVVPDTEELDVKVQAGESEAELEVEVDGEG
jgi:hypothetical protein